jgi:hypothetical protein
MSGNWATNLSDKPLFIEALMLMILVRPCVVRCAPFFFFIKKKKNKQLFQIKQNLLTFEKEWALKESPHSINPPRNYHKK